MLKFYMVIYIIIFIKKYNFMAKHKYSFNVHSLTVYFI